MVALRKPSFAKRHREAMMLAGEIGATLREMYRPATAMAKPEHIIRLLNKAKVRFVLMGTYGINGYRDESRATQDVDILVQPRDHAKAVQTIREAFPDLKEVDGRVVTRFLDPSNDKPVIDLMKPEFEVLKAVFRFSIRVGKTHRIPDLEMALVSKFAAMVSPHRSESRKFVDAGDFINMVETNRKRIDLGKLQKIAQKVYKGGGAEILNLIKDIDAGRRIRF